MARYEDNVYNWLKRKGLDKKYEHAGIYCIKIDSQIVYIGKSHNMLKRVAQHYASIQKETDKKYRILNEAKRKGHSINFDVLYYANSITYFHIDNEIGTKEGEFIRMHNPVLNTQIPKEENWHKFDVNTIDAKAIIKDLI